MKNALFISYYFPPSGGGGVKRPTKFVKYLHKYNFTNFEINWLMEEGHINEKK